MSPYYWLIIDSDTHIVIEIELTDADTEPPYSDDTGIDQILIQTDNPPTIGSVYNP